MFDIKKFEEADLKNPILIEGLPGIANVARISADFLIDELKAKKIYEIYSYYFPAFVILDEDSTITFPKVEIYHAKIDEKDVVLAISDVQPSDEYNYFLCEKIIELVKPIEIITIGGVGSLKSKIRVHAATTTLEVKDKLSKLPLIFDGNDSVSLIIGAAGILLGLAKHKNIPGFGLLVETEAGPTHFGIKASKKVLEILNQYLNLNCNLSEMEKDVKVYEKEMKKRARRDDEIREYMMAHSETDDRYIG